MVGIRMARTNGMTPGEVHREHMKHEIEYQNRQWKALNKRESGQWNDWVVFGFWVAVWAGLGALAYGLGWWVRTWIH